MSNLSAGIEKVKNREFEAAFELFKSGYFEEKDPECACYLAQMYYDKRITPRTEKSLRKAMLLWEITAANGKTSSKHKLGTVYFTSKNPRVKDYAIELITEARDEGYDVSNCVLGAVAYNNGRYDEAIEHFNRYANLKNDSTAYFYYGDCFIRRFDPDYKQAAKILDYCVSVHKNPKAAARLCDLYDKDAPLENIGDFYYYAKTEADLGSKPACEFIAVSIKTGEYNPPGASNAMMLHYLKEAEPELSFNGCCLAGDIYFEEYVNGGQSDERLYAVAKQYIERSLNLNCEFTLANHLMGDILLCKERRPEAAYYYEKAFKAGYEDSCESLFTTLAGMPGNQEKANRCARLIIKNNYKVTNPFVYSSVAFNIVQGLCGEKPDYAEAGRLFIRAAEMGDVISMDMVGLTRVEYGTSAVPTHVAIGWLEKADSLGSKDALYYLGVIYIQENQSAKAVDCLNKATDKGNADAARKMAELYECGYITGKRERKKAKSWKEIADRLEAAQ